MLTTALELAGVALIVAAVVLLVGVACAVGVAGVACLVFAWRMS
jgi:hypothetical protein